MEQKIPRLQILDSVRGILVVLMVIYHFFFDLDFLLGIQFSFFESSFTELIANVVRFLFIFLVGVNSKIILINSANLNEYTSKQYKRFWVLLLSAVMVSIGSYMFVPDLFIYFGVLHLIAFSLLFIITISKLRNFMYFIVGNVLVFLLLPLEYNIFYVNEFNKPSLDFFPIAPWIFPAILGYYSFNSILLYLKKASKFRLMFLEFIGRKSLIIYLLHQPVLIIILKLVVWLRIVPINY